MIGPGGDKNEARSELPVQVQNVTLDPLPHADGAAPISMLSFDVFNAGDVDISDLVLEATLTDRTVMSDTDIRTKIVAGPYTLIGRKDLTSWHTLHFAMVLRNLPRDCACSASVKVVSARVKRTPPRPRDDDEPLPV
jgi:hypothetical protein